MAQENEVPGIELRHAEGETMAHDLMAALADRAECSDTGVLLFPRIEILPNYVALKIGDMTLWDDEEENSGGLAWQRTVDTEMPIVKRNLRNMLSALTALVMPDCESQSPSEGSDDA